MNNLLFAVGISMLAGTLLAFDTPEEYKLPMAVSLILVSQFAIKDKLEDLEKLIKKEKKDVSIEKDSNTEG